MYGGGKAEAGSRGRNSRARLGTRRGRLRVCLQSDHLFVSFWWTRRIADSGRRSEPKHWVHRPDGFCRGWPRGSGAGSAIYRSMAPTRDSASWFGWTVLALRLRGRMGGASGAFRPAWRDCQAKKRCAQTLCPFSHENNGDWALSNQSGTPPSRWRNSHASSGTIVLTIKPNRARRRTPTTPRRFIHPGILNEESRCFMIVRSGARLQAQRSAFAGAHTG